MTEPAPDAEALTGAYLRDHDDVEELVDDRVGGDTPDAIARPWVRIIQIGDTTFSPSLRLYEVHLDLHCYGSSDRDVAHGEAGLLSRTVRAALNDMPEATHQGAVVTAVTFGGNPRIPDPDFKPARERFILSANVYLHAA